MRKPHAPATAALPHCLTVGTLLFLLACDDQPLRPGGLAHTPDSPAPDVPHVCDVVERVFTPRCAGCHGEGGVFPELTVTGAQALPTLNSQLYGGVPLLVAGDLEGSLLYRKVSGTQSENEGGVMPIGAPLDDAERNLIGSWIEEGASMDCTGPTPSDDGGMPPPPAQDAGVAVPEDDGGQPPAAQDITICDVNTAFFAPKCVSCHGAGGQPPDLSATGALSSLVNVEGAGGVVRVVPGDANASLLYQKLDGSAAGSRMPLGGMATDGEMELVRNWINQGATLDCSEAGDAGTMTMVDAGTGGGEMPPADTTPVCSSGEYWTDGDDGDPRMHPGRACLSCHTAMADDEDTPNLWVGGTVYPTRHEPDDCLGADGRDTYDGAFVRIIDAMGRQYDLDVNRNGNFLLRKGGNPFDMPFRASLHYDGRVREMHGAKSTGDCNSCHTVQGTNYAPGRIYLP